MMGENQCYHCLIQAMISLIWMLFMALLRNAKYLRNINMNKDFQQNYKWDFLKYLGNICLNVLFVFDTWDLEEPKKSCTK
jgi:hypothetical protein